MFRYILLSINLLIFTPLFYLLIVLTGIFDTNKNNTGYLTRLWACIILKFTNIQYSIEGFDKLDFKKKYIIISNHQSVIDILIAFAIFPMPISFFTKKELFYIPLFGFAMKCAGMVPVDRYNKEKSKKSVDMAVYKIHATNLSFVNFPDGTRMPFGELGKFKKGGFILAVKSGLPIIPLAISYNKSLIRVVVDDVIDSLNYELSTKDLLIEKTRNVILSNLNT